jgi:hypothetical protein
VVADTAGKEDGITDLGSPAADLYVRSNDAQAGGVHE